MHLWSGILPHTLVQAVHVMGSCARACVWLLRLLDGKLLRLRTCIVVLKTPHLLLQHLLLRLLLHLLLCLQA